MKAGIYNPYWDTLGGGERYTASFIKVLLDSGHKVDVEWSGKNLTKELQNRFGIDLAGANIVPSIKKGDGYDLLFWLSDGSIPLLKSRKNILHFQFPFTNTKGKSLVNKMKLFRINEIVCNSYFTKRIIDKEYGVASTVIYPPVDVTAFKSKRKENIILYVGRFSKLTQAKRQDVLVRSFKKMVDSGVSGWKLVLAGGSEVGGKDFLKKLIEEAKEYPIEILESPNFKTIKDLFGKAKIFWSAAGFGIDEEKEPKKVEHFGITVVEAMAAGSVPIVYDAGGHKEIVEDNFNGFLWRQKTELLDKTLKLISDNKQLKKISKQAMDSSKVYELQRFNAEVEELFK